MDQPTLEQLKRLVLWKVEECHNLAREKWPDSYLIRTIPIVEWYEKSATAGWALKSKIGINTYFLQTESKNMIEDTVPHEMAHLICGWVFPQDRGHGKRWRQVAKFLGIEEVNRTHDYDVSHIHPYRYECPHPRCETFHDFSKRRHNRVVRDGQKYLCKNHGLTLEFKGIHGDSSTSSTGSFNSTETKRRQVFIYKCSCKDRTHTFSKRRHNNVVLRGKSYSCNQCRQEVTLYKEDWI